MKTSLTIIFIFLFLNIFAAYQYNIKGNQGWLSFDSDTTLSFELSRSGKDKEHENFIDRGEEVVDYGWYHLETGESGSFNNGLSATFKESDKIGLYITDNKGNTYLSTKPKTPFEDDIWGKTRLIGDTLFVAGGNFGSNGTHEYYVFKVNSIQTSKTPTGQPLPGIIATLLIGCTGIFYLKNRKKLIQNH